VSDFDQPTLWDLEAGEADRDAGMVKVIENTRPSYRDAFDTVVRDFRTQGQDFTSEDVTARIGLPPGHPNAVGALTRAVATKYGAVKVGRRKAQRRNQHATEIAVWGWR
jgi:hypothetical protein